MEAIDFVRAFNRLTSGVVPRGIHRGAHPFIEPVIQDSFLPLAPKALKIPE